MKVSGMFLAAALVLGSSRLALSQTTTDLNNEAARMNTLTAGQGESKVIGKITGEFDAGQHSRGFTTPGYDHNHYQSADRQDGFWKRVYLFGIGQTAVGSIGHYTTDPRAIEGCSHWRDDYDEYWNNSHGNNTDDLDDNRAGNLDHAQSKYGLGADRTEAGI